MYDITSTLEVELQGCSVNPFFQIESMSHQIRSVSFVLVCAWYISACTRPFGAYCTCMYCLLLKHIHILTFTTSLTQHVSGGIELSIFSEHFKVEIAVVDIQSQRIDLFGQFLTFC